MGVASRYDISVAVGEIGKELGILTESAKVLPIKSKDYNSLAKRPDFSILDSSLTYELLKYYPHHWRKSLYYSLKYLVSKKIIT